MTSAVRLRVGRLDVERAVRVVRRIHHRQQRPSRRELPTTVPPQTGHQPSSPVRRCRPSCARRSCRSAVGFLEERRSAASFPHPCCRKPVGRTDSSGSGYRTGFHRAHLREFLRHADVVVQIARSYGFTTRVASCRATRCRCLRMVCAGLSAVTILDTTMRAIGRILCARSVSRVPGDS